MNRQQGDYLSYCCNRYEVFKQQGKLHYFWAQYRKQMIKEGVYQQFLVNTKETDHYDNQQQFINTTGQCVDT